MPEAVVVQLIVYAQLLRRVGALDAPEGERLLRPRVMRHGEDGGTFPTGVPLVRQILRVNVLRWRGLPAHRQRETRQREVVDGVVVIVVVVLVLGDGGHGDVLVSRHRE